MKTNQPRIALVVPRFPAPSETFIVNKFLGLLDRGFDVHVVAGRIEGQLFARFPALAANRGAMRRLHTSWPTSPRAVVPMLAPGAAFALLARRGECVLLRYLTGLREKGAVERLKAWYIDAAVAALRPDVVHFEFGALAVDRMHLKRLLKTKITVSFRGHDISYVGLGCRDHYKEVWEKAERVHFLGSDLLERARRRGFPPGVPYDLIPPGIDTTAVDPGRARERSHLQVDQQPVRILSVGRLHWAKGHEYALHALALLKASGVPFEFRLIGAGAHESAVRFACTDFGLEHDVQYLGERRHSEVISEMQASDIFLHASVSEGFCNAVLEAQAMMLPVVCSDAGGLAENVQHGVTGFVVPKRDPHALAEALLKLARDPGLRNRMGVAGRERVEREFSLEANIARFAAFYERAMAGRDPGTE